MKRSDRLFTNKDLSSGIARKTVKGGIDTVVSSLINFSVSLGGIILITRNLTTEDFGLYGMVFFLTGFASLFVNIGLNQAVIQWPVITHRLISTLFWINTAIASVIALIMIALTPLLVWFYSEPRLVPINIVLSMTFILSAMRLQHQALLKRNMAFRAISIMGVVSVVLATMTGAFLAIYGFGVWALVAIPVVSQVLGVIFDWAYSGWIPGKPGRGHGIRKMVKFGGNVTGFRAITHFISNGDNMALGYAWGAGPLGLYIRSYSLMQLPITKFNIPLNGVVIPILSRIVDQPDRYRSVYENMTRVIAIVFTPMICVLILTIHTIVPLLFGEQWIPMIPIFYAMSFIAVIGATMPINSWLYLTIGHVDRALKWSLYTAPIRILFLCAGLQYGPVGMGVALSGLAIVLRPVGIAYAARGTPVRYWQTIGDISYPVIGSGIAAGIALLVSHFLWNGQNLVVEFFLLTALFFVVYGILLLATKPGKKYSASLLMIINEVRP